MWLLKEGVPQCFKVAGLCMLYCEDMIQWQAEAVIFVLGSSHHVCTMQELCRPARNHIRAFPCNFVCTLSLQSLQCGWCMNLRQVGVTERKKRKVYAINYKRHDRSLCAREAARELELHTVCITWLCKLHVLPTRLTLWSQQLPQSSKCTCGFLACMLMLKIREQTNIAIQGDMQHCALWLSWHMVQLRNNSSCIPAKLWVCGQQSTVKLFCACLCFTTASSQCCNVHVFFQKRMSLALSSTWNLIIRLLTQFLDMGHNCRMLIKTWNGTEQNTVCEAGSSVWKKVQQAG